MLDEYNLDNDTNEKVTDLVTAGDVTDVLLPPAAVVTGQAEPVTVLGKGLRAVDWTEVGTQYSVGDLAHCVRD